MQRSGALGKLVQTGYLNPALHAPFDDVLKWKILISVLLQIAVITPLVLIPPQFWLNASISAEGVMQYVASFAEMVMYYTGAILVPVMIILSLLNLILLFGVLCLTSIMQNPVHLNVHRAARWILVPSAVTGRLVQVELAFTALFIVAYGITSFVVAIISLMITIVILIVVIGVIVSALGSIFR